MDPCIIVRRMVWRHAGAAADRSMWCVRCARDSARAFLKRNVIDE